MEINIFFQYLKLKTNRHLFMISIIIIITYLFDFVFSHILNIINFIALTFFNRLKHNIIHRALFRTFLYLLRF